MKRRKQRHIRSPELSARVIKQVSQTTSGENSRNKKPAESQETFDRGR